MSQSETPGAAAGDSPPYDAILIIGFGGPEKPDDVMPFLENVTRGRGVPRERLLEVAEHYYHFGGVSPINTQVRDLIAALTPELQAHGVKLPVYWGNRNWHPLLPDTLREMTEAGVKHALGVVLAAYSSYSSCRQYREDVQRARDEVGPNAPIVDKMRVYYNHPDFVAANAERVRDALAALPEGLRDQARIAFTAHSIPSSMAQGCDYEKQLTECCRLVAEAAGIAPERWQLVYQSRSGRPTDPWLAPDILEHIDDLKTHGTEAVVIHPIGFLSDHMEVLFDLDEEAKQRCDQHGIAMVRSATVGTHPTYVGMLRELIMERLEARAERRAIGQFGPNHDVCPVNCCPAPQRPAGRPAAS
ncbi:MAG: ferrochelatase [Isosphaeraceae bacterium]